MRDRRVTLLYVYSYRRTRITRNVAREVTAYLGPPVLIVNLYKNYIRLCDLETAEIHAINTPIRFTLTSRYCFMTPTRVFCLIDSSATCQFDSICQSTELFPPMLHRRLSPGMIHIESSVYLFGGVFLEEFTGERLSLSHRKWSFLPSLPYPAGSLFPCAVTHFIYFCVLCGFTVFDTSTSISSLIPIEFPDFIQPILMYVQENCIQTLTNKGDIVTWIPGNSTVTVTQGRNRNWREYKPCMPPIDRGNRLVWTTFGGDLVVFDRERMDIETEESPTTRGKKRFQAICGFFSR